MMRLWWTPHRGRLTRHAGHLWTEPGDIESPQNEGGKWVTVLDALGFPSDEDVEAATRAVAQERWGASELTTPKDQLIARAALQAVAEARYMPEVE